MACELKTKKNIGVYQCQELPQLIKAFIITSDNWRMPWASRATFSAWQDAIFSPTDRIYFFPPIVGLEAANTEATYEDTPFALLPVSDGQYRMRVFIRQNMCVHKAMRSHRATNGRIILLDKNNKMLGMRDEAGDFMGVKLALLNTEKLMLNDGTRATQSPIYIALEDAADIDEYGELIDGKLLKSIKRIVDVTIEKVSAGASSIVVDVKVDCDGLGVTGLLAADFLIYDPGTGASHAISGVTASPTIPGRYTIAGTGFLTNSTLTLRKADQLTIDGYEHPEAVVITF